MKASVLLLQRPLESKRRWSWPSRNVLLLLITLAGWWFVYGQLQSLSSLATHRLLRLSADTHFGAAEEFFIYEVPKVLMLLTLVVFGVGMLRTFVTPERTRKILAGKRESVGNVLASMLGVFTPFCSCSAVPLFIGFVASGVPLGVTFSFLIAAPMVNEVALVLLFGLFGWRVAALYLSAGILIAIVAGWTIGRLHMEKHVEQWALRAQVGSDPGLEVGLNWDDRINRGSLAVREIVKFPAVESWGVSQMVIQSQVNKAVALILCLAFMNTGRLAFAQTPSNETLTLSQAVDIALAMNPLTRVSAAGRQLADAQLAAARASRLPLLQASESVTTSNNPVFVFGSLLEQGRFGANNFLISSLNNPDALTNFRAGLSVRVPLFDQRQSKARIDVAKFGQQQADQQTELVAQKIRFEVLNSYYGLLLAQSRLVVADEAIQIGMADLKRIKDKFETGFVVRSDLLAAEVQLSEFRQQKIEASGELGTAQAALNTVLGLPVNSPHTITDQLTERLFSVETQDELIRLAIEQRPEYARALLAVRSNARQVFGARDEALPRVDAFAGVGASGRSPVTSSSDYTVGAVVTLNLFDAGRKARIDQARATEAIAVAEKEQVANQISFEVVHAYQQFVSARQRLLVVSQTTAQASEVLRIVRDRYHEGLTTITEVLRAELALVRARTDVLTARHDHYVAYANVLLATGRLKDVRPFVL